MPGLAGPGSSGGGATSLIDMMGTPGGGAPQPPRLYGSFDPDMAYYMQPSVPLYSGGGGVGMTAGSGGGGGVFSPPDDLRKYFNADGSYKLDDPRTVASDAGVSVSDLASNFFPRYGNKPGEYAGQGYGFPSDKGGFFSLDSLYDLTRQPTPVAGALGRGGQQPMANLRTANMPQIGSFQSGMPSTNNWRLLGRGPGWIMRNGMLIDTRSAGVRMGGPAGWTPSGGNSGEQSMPAIATSLGAGAGFGVPNILQAGLGQPITYGWPGATNWFSAGDLST